MRKTENFPEQYILGIPGWTELLLPLYSTLKTFFQNQIFLFFLQVVDTVKCLIYVSHVQVYACRGKEIVFFPCQGCALVGASVVRMKGTQEFMFDGTTLN